MQIKKIKPHQINNKKKKQPLPPKTKQKNKCRTPKIKKKIPEKYKLEAYVSVRLWPPKVGVIGLIKFEDFINLKNVRS